MKKRQHNSARAAALQITLSVVLLSVSAILFASSFKAALPGSPQADVVAQPGFFPPLPLGPGPTPTPSPVPITVSLPIASFDTSVPIATVIIQPVNTTNIDPSLNYVGFQGDLTFDSAV